MTEVQEFISLIATAIVLLGMSGIGANVDTKQVKQNISRRRR